MICLASLNFSFAQGLKISSLKSQDSLTIKSGSSLLFHKSIIVNPTQNIKSLMFKSPYQHKDAIGFFCRWELKMDKQVNNPVRFRLGSYDYVNRMEGK